ncbi:hypothetical protein B0A48_15994 [Cryoendolithus antarcticus]|uniref:Protein kinase domain-containing protein n=1 Tax=Cryoendolithus antarcticus TaxID=1507870 RepID=A0A1V8SG80_9PEZI|nr:hypothetical protein B0A48_15994 [Cryoendolithus antarcticus]
MIKVRPQAVCPEGGHNVFAYDYLDHDFLDLITKVTPLRASRQILETSLRGLADLHDRDIVHLDVKPSNIVASLNTASLDVVEKTTVIDIENAAYLPYSRHIKGTLIGHEYWRTPEAHFKGKLNKPTDIFIYALVCIHTVLGRIIQYGDADLVNHVKQGTYPTLVRLQRLVAYFGCGAGLEGLKRHVGDENINCQILDAFWEDTIADYHEYRPFKEWPDVTDAAFADLIVKMTNLDPGERLRAEEALAHPWFDIATDMEVLQ